MTIAQVLTQQVERVNNLESEIKEKEQLIGQAEVDLKDTKKALQKEKERLEEKEKAFNELITSQKQKAAEESKLVEELKVTKGLVRKAQHDLETQTNALNEKLEKVKRTDVSTNTLTQMNEVSTQTVPEIKVSHVKQEESEVKRKEKKKSIPCKYFNTTKGCRRGKRCWFYHDYNHNVDKKHTKLQQNTTERFEVNPNIEKELKQEQGASLKPVILELLKLLLRENDI